MDKAPRGYRLFEIAGFEVRLDPSWLFLGLLIAWTLAADVFPQRYPKLDPSVYRGMGIVCAARTPAIITTVKATADCGGNCVNTDA